MHWLSALVIAFALVAITVGAPRASHEKSSTFTSTVFPKGPAVDGTYISGKCVANVDVEEQSVVLAYCTFGTLPRR